MASGETGSALAKAIDELKRRRPEHIKLHATYKAVLSGTQGGTWRIDFKNGGRVLDGDGLAEVTFEAEPQVFLDIVAGRLDPEQAGKQGKVRWTGDRAHFQRMAALFKA